MQKEKRRREINSRRGRLLVVVVVWVFSLIYFLSPLSRVATPKVSGLVYLSRQQIIDVSSLKSQRNSFIWDVDGVAVAKAVEASNLTYIVSSRTSRSLTGVRIEVVERYPVAVSGDLVLLSDGQVIAMSQARADGAHLVDTGYGNIIDVVPRFGGEGDLLVLGRMLGRCDRGLLNDNVETLTFVGGDLLMVISDSRLAAPVEVLFDSLSDIPYFLSGGVFQRELTVVISDGGRSFRFLVDHLVANGI